MLVFLHILKFVLLGYWRNLTILMEDKVIFLLVVSYVWRMCKVFAARESSP